MNAIFSDTIKSFKQKFLSRKGVFVSVAWLAIWAGYNTTITKVFEPGFPHGALDLIHGLRAFLPILAGLFSLGYLFLYKKYSLPSGFFTSPLGLLSFYVIVGTISSVFSTNLIEALYWALMYGSVLAVLLVMYANTDAQKNVSVAIALNWFIAGALTIGLLVFFLIQPGVLHSLTYNFLVCAERPYEALGNISKGAQFLGMVGTRPTGLARYAGVISLVTFIYFLYSTKSREKILWFISFMVVAGILLFSKGKTEIVAFIFGMLAGLWFYKRLKTWWILSWVLVVFLSAIIILYNIPCTNSVSLLTGFFQKPVAIVAPSPNIASTTPSGDTDKTPSSNAIPVITQAPTPIPAPVKTNISLEPSSSSIKKLVTLSGRTDGVWSDAWHLFLTAPIMGRGFQADRFFLEGQHAHNTLLHALVQTGLLGTIPFIFALLLTLVMAWQFFRNNNVSQQEKQFLVGAMVVLVFFLIRGLTESLAFFSADWLFLAPIIVYIQILNESHAK